MTDFVQSRGGLLVPLAEFAEAAAPARPELGEIASIQRDINRVMFGGVLENLDDTLKTRGGGKGLKIYEELERDAHAYAVLQKRRLAVTSRPWQVDPASDAPQDKRAAELVTAQFKALGFDRLTRNLLDAVNKGFGVGEVLWEIRGAEIWAAKVKPRNQRRFVFGEDEALRLVTRENLMTGEALPARKFIVHRFGDDTSPYGLGLGNKLFWPVFFKRQDITFWLTFADKFGMPTAVGKYPSGAGKPEQAKLLAALAAIAQDAGVIVPEGMLIELLEAARGGSIDTYEKLARYMDEQISECVLGESLSTTPQATGLGSGVASVQNEVRKEIAQADADEISETLNESLVRWIVDFNLPGAGYPTVWRSFEEPTDLQMRSSVDQALHEMGYEPESIEYINEIYGGKWKKKAASGSPAAGAAPAADGAPAQFAEVDAAAFPGQAALDRALGALPPGGQQQLEPLLTPVLELVKSGASYVDLMEKLADTYPKMDAAQLEELLARALFVADLWGRINADAGAG